MERNPKKAAHSVPTARLCHEIADTYIGFFSDFHNSTKTAPPMTEMLSKKEKSAASSFFNPTASPAVKVAPLREIPV